MLRYAPAFLSAEESWPASIPHQHACVASVSLLHTRAHYRDDARLQNAHTAAWLVGYLSAKAIPARTWVLFSASRHFVSCVSSNYYNICYVNKAISIVSLTKGMIK